MSLHRRAFLASAAALPLASAAQPVSALARDLAWVDATETASLIRRREISAAEAVKAAIERAKAVNPKLNFLVTPDFERAMARAASPDTGPFAGMPLLVKDLDDFEGVPTRSGSRANAGLPAEAKTEPRVQAMLAAGFNPIGKSATPEYGFLPTTEPLLTGPTRNPWNSDHSSGGSSGGAASAVAAGVLPLSHATDGGGSIRIPAACCGLVGLKPSRARVIGDRDGSVELSRSLCVSRTVRDTAAFLAAVEVRGEGAKHAPVGMVAGPSTRKLKVGFITSDPLGHAADAEVAEAVEQTALLLESLGHDAQPMERWPMSADGFTQDFLNLWSHFGMLVAAGVDKAAGAGTAARVLEPFTLGLAENRKGLSEEAFQASIARLVGAGQAYLTAFQSHDVILSPVLASTAAPLGFLAPTVDQAVLVERLTQYVGYTPLNNVAGNPAISLPMAWSSAGLPIGVQFAADTGKERTLLELAYQLEAARPWAAKRPTIHA